MVFGWFKKKKEDEDKPLYDPTNIKLNQLVKGAFLDYDLKTWQVKEVYEYDWGDDYFSDEFKLATAEEAIYLHVEEEDDLECTVSQKINIYDIDGEVVDQILQTDSPPMKLTYNGETYFRHSENIGYYRNVENERWRELVSWTYHDRDQVSLLSIERWGQEDFEASIGKMVQALEFYNIIMP